MLSVEGLHHKVFKIAVALLLALGVRVGAIETDLPICEFFYEHVFENAVDVVVIYMSKLACVVVSYSFYQDVVFKVSLCHICGLVFINTYLAVHGFKLAYITGFS
jgi:hypothetical protein